MSGKLYAITNMLYEQTRESTCITTRVRRNGMGIITYVLRDIGFRIKAGFHSGK